MCRFQLRDGMSNQLDQAASQAVVDDALIDNASKAGQLVTTYEDHHPSHV
jgi:hypothetical protein